MDRLDGYLLLTMSDFEMYGCYLLDTDRYAAEGFHRGLTITLLERHVEGTWEAEAEKRTFTVREVDLTQLPTHSQPYFHTAGIKEVVRRAIDCADISTTDRETLRAHLAASTLSRTEAPMILNLHEGAVPERVSGLSDGPLDIRAHHYDSARGTYIGEFLFRVRNGRINYIEYVWVTDDPPSIWPGAEVISFQPPHWMTADLSVEILPEFRDKLPEKGFTVGSRSAMLRFHQGYVGMLITGIYRVPGQQHYRVRVATWKDFTPFAVRSGALFMLWCGGDFGRGVVLQGSQL